MSAESVPELTESITGEVTGRADPHKLEPKIGHSVVQRYEDAKFNQATEEGAGQTHKDTLHAIEQGVTANKPIDHWKLRDRI